MTGGRFRWQFLTILSVVMTGSAAWGATVRVPLVVQEPTGLARTDWPITSGIPFAKGALAASEPARLTEADGNKPLPLQTRVTCRWPDGSVKWLLIDSRLSLTAGQTKKLYLESGGGAVGAPESPGGILSASKNSEGVTVSTGPLRATLKQNVNLPGPVRFDLNNDGKCADDEQIATSPWKLILERPDGHRYSSDVLPANIEIEETGALRTVVRIEGQLADTDRNPWCRYLVRLHFYAGQSCVRAFVTLTVDDPNQVMVDIGSFKLVVPTDGAAEGTLTFGGQASKTGAVHQMAGADGEHRLFQVDDRTYRVDGQEAGKRAAGWSWWSGSRSGVGAGVRDFWQQWPKAISAGKEGLTLELIPPFEAGLYDNETPTNESKWTYALRGGKTRIKVGVAKTHEVWIWYGKADQTAEQAESSFRQGFNPLIATCEPGYICATKALGDFPPADPADPDRFTGYDRLVALEFEKHLVDRENTREYGLLNWGDWWGERGYNWGNLEYDMARGLITQYARTGNRAYYLRAEEAARHHIDIDVVHAVNPQLKNPWGSPPVVGNEWVHATGHTGGYFADGAFKLESPYTRGYSLNLGHIWDRGDLDYYFLSGDERAREVALQVAETLRRDAAPHFKIGTHMRDIGWPMLALMAAYRATGETKYLDAVRQGWQVLKAGEDPNGGWVVTLAKGHCLHDPTQCKGNVTFIMGIVLSALADYHRETGDPEVAKAIVRAVDFTIRETYVPDKKMFRYTSCPLTPTSPSGLVLFSESLSYAWQLSGDEKFRRVFREATEELNEVAKKSGMGKGFSQHLIFGPESLWALDRKKP